MSNTIQKYKDYVMTGFLKSVAPIVIDRASGCTVVDANGREYLDCFSGISVVSAGHCNPQVIAAAKKQMDKLVHCSSYLYHVQPVADLPANMNSSRYTPVFTDAPGARLALPAIKGGKSAAVRMQRGLRLLPHPTSIVRSGQTIPKNAGSSARVRLRM